MAEEEIEIPVNPKRIIEQLSTSTIKDPIDAVVELVTNSDDSYRRLEDKRKDHDGYIEIVINGDPFINEIICTDHAEGMTKNDIEKIMEFGGDTSEFFKQKSVRGLFGRGLKEAIFGLGKGEIKTIKDEKLTVVHCYKNDKGKFVYKFLAKNEKANKSLRKNLGIPKNGTFARIEVLKVNKYLIADRVSEQIRHHYALRNILTSEKREVFLKINLMKEKIKYIYPKRELVGSVNKPKRIFLGKNDAIDVLIYESKDPLDSYFENTYSNSGILIEVEGSILDNKFFKYESEPAALYFSGKVICNGIATFIRKNHDYGVISPDRSGISWRHPYCKKIKELIEKELQICVEKKKLELEKAKRVSIPESLRKNLSKIAEELSKLFENELEEEGKLTKKEKGILKDKFIIIKPEKANLELDIPRVFSVYVSHVLKEKSKDANVLVSSSNSNIELDRRNVELRLHKKYRDIYYGFFKATGKVIGEIGILTAMLWENEAKSEVAVRPQKKSKKKKKLEISKKGRWFNEIITNTIPNPIQRVRFNRDSGNIEIFVMFPFVKEYIKPGLEGINSVEGKILSVELLTEVFCRELTIAKIEKGQGMNDIIGFLRIYDDLQKKYSEIISKIIENYIL